MKKMLSLFLALLLILSVATGCAASRSSDTAVPDEGYYGDGYYDNGSSSGETSEDAVKPEEPAYSGSSESDTDVVFTAATTTGAASMADKIIYSAYASLETIDFDGTIQELYTMMDAYGAFIESSSITGADYASSYYGYQTYRTADFVVRVPVSAYETMTENLSQLGNVTNFTSNAENITTQYTDVQSRLNAYRTEEESLLQMLAKAETVSDMLDIQSRLSNVRYEIESLTTQLNNWDNQVSYSTVTVRILEVVELSEKVEIQRSYWQQVGDGFTNTMEGLWRFTKNVFKAFVAALPVLLVLAVMTLVVTFIVRTKIRRTKKKIAMGKSMDEQKGDR